MPSNQLETKPNFQWTVSTVFALKVVYRHFVQGPKCQTKEIAARQNITVAKAAKQLP